MLAPRTSAEPAKASAAPLRPAQPFFKPAPVRQAAQARQPAVPTAAPSAAGPDLLGWLPDSLRAAASDHAHHFRGFPLLTVLLGLDPFTNQAVPRTPDTLVHGLLALMPDGEAQYAHLQQAGALPKAFNWLSTEADRRHLRWSAVRGMLATAWRSFSGTDLLLHPVDTLTRLAEPFRHLAAEAAGFAGAVTEQVLEFVFSSVLGPDAARIMAVLKRAGAAFRLVLRDPVRFAGYLARAATLGFEQFRAHAAQHLQQGLAGWLLGGPLAGLGLRLPARLDGPGLLSLGLQTLGLGYDYLRARLVARVGAPAVARLEQGLGLLRTLLTQGLSAAAGQLSELASSLPELVLNQLEAWVSRTVLTQALLKLGTLLVPGGAVVEAVRGVYNTVQFFLERGQQLGAVVSTFLDALGTIAAGGVVAAATRLEQTMGRLVPVVLAFLARLTGLGDIGKPIQALLLQLRRPLEAALEKLVGLILKLGQKLLAPAAPVAANMAPAASPATTTAAVAAPADPRTLAQKTAALDQAVAAGTALLRDERLPEAELATQLATLQAQHRLTTLRLVREPGTGETETVHLYGEVNPQRTGPPVRRPRRPPAGATPAVRPPVQVAQAIRALYLRALAPAVVTEVDEPAQLVRHRFTNPRLVTAVQKNTFAEFTAKLRRGDITLVNPTREYLMNNRPRYRAGLVVEVWERAKRRGRVFDPNADNPRIELFWDTNKSRQDQWHMGHKPGAEYWRMVDGYISGQTTHQEFLDKYNNPANYWPEDPKENVSHRHEAP